MKEVDVNLVLKSIDMKGLSSKISLKISPIPSVSGHFAFPDVPACVAHPSLAEAFLALGGLLGHPTPCLSRQAVCLSSHRDRAPVS